MNKDLEKIKKQILPILKKHDIKKAAIFGSLVRGEAKKNSDVDIVIQIEKDISLLDFIGIKLEIEDTLGRKIDLVEYDTLKPIIKERILSEQSLIYG
ncbi:nucleotidyltransferase family protein [Patescibacteria group bacterium]|nr:nucleotidyltransferase family protein [Patescibacteria group bacterium]